jgi:hypothetical protein
VNHHCFAQQTKRDEKVSIEMEISFGSVLFHFFNFKMLILLYGTISSTIRIPLTPLRFKAVDFIITHNFSLKTFFRWKKTMMHQPQKNVTASLIAFAKKADQMEVTASAVLNST